jgi:hypothetical protein
LKRADFIELSRTDQSRELDDLEERIELLKAAYGRYFNGVDDRIPAKEHHQLKKDMRRLMNRRFKGTELKFRFNGLRSRLITYEQYWRRIQTQIEKGTYRRLLAVSRQRGRKIARGLGGDLEQLRGATFELGAAAEVGGGAVDMEQLAAAAAEAVDQARAEPKPAEGPPASIGPRRGGPRASRGPRARAQLPDGIDAKEARRLFKEFVQAKKKLGQDTSGLTYGKLVKKLARDIPKLKQKAGDRAVELEVRTEGGKVRLRARGS